jgi:tetratricopeptide (TPR) repeat protein
VRLTPLDRKVHRYLARSAFEVGRYEDALRAYTGALRISPRDKTFYNDVGYTYFRLKRYHKALYVFNRTLSLAPDYRLAHENLLNLGHVAMQAQDYTLAHQAFSSLIEVKPQLSETIVGMCQALAGLKQIPQAVSWCQQAVRLQPANQVYLGQFALVLLRLQQLNKVLHWAHYAVEIAPTWGFGHRILGDIYIALEEVQQAEEAYQAALAIDPKDQVASDRLSILKQAEAK